MSLSNKPSLDNETLLVKLLIPSASAGIILGKGGETIICLQSQYCTNIKLSKAGDFFPGTMDRVCAILGSQKGIRSVLDVIVEKIRDKPNSHGVPSELKVKLVVPHTTASLIYNYTARIQRKTSVRVHVMERSEDSALHERIIIVQGETSTMGHALDMILEYIFTDPLSNSCPSVSYCDAQLGPSLAGSSGSSVASQLHTGIIPNHPSFAMLRNSLRFGGYTETAIEEVVAAVYTLVSYGFLALPEGGTDMHPSSLAAVLGIGTAAGSQLYPVGTSVSSPTADYSTTVTSTTADYAMTVSAFTNNCANASMSYSTYQTVMNFSTSNFSSNAAYQYYGHAPYNPSNYAAGCSSFAPPPPPPTAPHSTDTTTHSFEVGEHIVGALLGPGGRSIVDLQTWSGATVEVSKKGIYAPGTRNRIVTVMGSTPAVQSATYFIKQCIDHEEMRRATQQPTVPHTDRSVTGHSFQPWPTPPSAAR